MVDSILQAGALTLALSLDTFTAALALGAQKIRMPALSKIALSLTCSLSLWAAMALGGTAGGWIAPRFASGIGCGLLVLMGAVRLCDGLLKRFLRRCCENREGMVFRFQNLEVFLRVCVDSTQADFNGSQSLSVVEAVSLAAALSLDGLAAGFGAGMLEQDGRKVLVLALAVNLLMLQIGWKLGKRCSERVKGDLSWLAGAVLITMGLLRLVK